MRSDEISEPNLVSSTPANLSAAGTFGAEAMAAAQMAQQEIDRLIASGYQEHEAEEVVLQQFRTDRRRSRRSGLDNRTRFGARRLVSERA